MRDDGHTELQLIPSIAAMALYMCIAGALSVRERNRATTLPCVPWGPRRCSMVTHQADLVPKSVTLCRRR
jgi:hypothetical protein